MSKSAIEREYTPFGYKTIYYRDDDNNSGCGENPRIAEWYGPNAPGDLPESDFQPFALRPQVDEFDLMCERRHD